MGSLTLSVYGVHGTTTLLDLVHGPGARWTRYGTAMAAEITGAGFELWPTDVMVGGEIVPYSRHHFDIPLHGGDPEIMDRYPSLSPSGRRAVRDELRPPFAELLGVFKPRRVSDFAGPT